MTRTVTVVLSLATLAVGAGAPAVNGATPAQVVRANRQAATGAADHLLAQVVLPAGATEIPSEPKGDAQQLARPDELFIFAAEVDRHQFWTTAATPDAVIASIQANLPAGAQPTGSGDAGTSAFASYSLPALPPPTLGSPTVDVEAAQLTNGRTGVRADAVVRYSAPRLAAQRIPPQTSTVQITIANYGSAPVLSLTVNRRSEVRRVAAIVNQLPFAAPLRGVPISCPAMWPAPLDTFTFRKSPTGPVLAQVSEPANTPTQPDPCAITTLTIRGHREPGLLAGGALLRRAGTVLGVKLTRR
jgi:hypothetical protein